MPKLLPLILVGGLPKSGKTSFINRITPQITGVKVFNEENYVNQVNPRGHDYALDYSENAENLVRQAMVKDVALAAYNRKPVIAESSFFVDAAIRAEYREKTLTPDHMPIYVSVFIPEKVRAKNKVLDKYTEADNADLMQRNKRPRKGEGFVVMSVREVIEYLKEYNEPS